MNDKVKEILNNITSNGMRELTDERLNQFAIEICELQKIECAKFDNLELIKSNNIFEFDYRIVTSNSILKTKNIAE